MSLTYLQLIKLIISIIMTSVLQRFFELSFIEQVAIFIGVFLFFFSIRILRHFPFFRTKNKNINIAKTKDKNYKREKYQFFSYYPIL